MTASASVRTFVAGDEPAILAVIDAALLVDRLPGITRQDLVHGVNRLAGDPGGTVVALDGEEIVGYCTPRHDDLTVHPEFRRRGHGRRLVAAALGMLRSRGQPNLILYGPADQPAAAGFIDALGFTYTSSLWLFELAPEIAVPPPEIRDDVTVRTYRHPDDLAAFVRLANASFIGHPTPMTFTEPTVAHTHGLAEFDPHGILLVAPRDEPELLIGWAKAEHEIVESGERRGFVSFIGVVPEWRGRGLGRELLRWAVGYCRDAGSGTIELNVEAANDRALTLYRQTGFTAEVEWPHYALPVG